jgi:cellulase
MASRFVLAASAALAIHSVTAQQPGSTPEKHPELTTYKCTTSGGCVAQKTSLVLDWGNHKLEQTDGSACPVSNTSAVCSDNTSCNKNCVVQGIDYANAGVRTSGDALTLNQYISGNAVSPRVYLLDPNGQEYENVQLTGQELTFDVELSTLPCGMNGALYLSEMAMSGGKSATNPGAEYGSGYCDAQCPKQTWFNGTVNNGVLGSEFQNPPSHEMPEILSKSLLIG